MTDKPTVPPRERILAAADDLFRRQGIRGIGVEAIAEAAGTNKMTLYRHFESKDELVAEWVRGIIAQKDAAWDDIAAQYPDDPNAQLIEWSRRTAAAFAQMEERGSPILNAIAELPQADHPARRVIDDHRRREHDRIVALCREAGFAEPELAGDELWFLLEGAKCSLQCMGLKRAGENLMRLVDTMVATQGRSARSVAR